MRLGNNVRTGERRERVWVNRTTSGARGTTTCSRAPRGIGTSVHVAGIINPVVVEQASVGTPQDKAAKADNTVHMRQSRKSIC